MSLPGNEPVEYHMLKCLISESDGQDMVEYALLVAVVALGAVAALRGFQNVIANIWSTVSNSLTGGS